MTPEEFKQKYPEYADLEGYELWNKMEDVLVKIGNSWTADYSDGYDVIELREDVEFHQNKYWINDATSERITNEEFEKRTRRKHINLTSNPLTSFSWEIVDFGKSNTDEK